jgi:hypothetical protein
MDYLCAAAPPVPSRIDSNRMLPGSATPPAYFRRPPGLSRPARFERVGRRSGRIESPNASTGAADSWRSAPALRQSAPATLGSTPVLRSPAALLPLARSNEALPSSRECIDGVRGVRPPFRTRRLRHRRRSAALRGGVPSLFFVSPPGDSRFRARDRVLRARGRGVRARELDTASRGIAFSSEGLGTPTRGQPRSSRVLTFRAGDRPLPSERGQRGSENFGISRRQG